MTIETLVDDFSLLDDWEDRYRHLIELGKQLSPITDDERNDTNKVRGCASQVWLVIDVADAKNPIITFRGDSDAHIVRGLIYILVTLFSGQPASNVSQERAKETFAQLGLDSHLSAQRTNGLYSMVQRLAEAAQTKTGP